MSKVYIILEIDLDYYDNEFINSIKKVFSNKEKADEYCSNLNVGITYSNQLTIEVDRELALKTVEDYRKMSHLFNHKKMALAIDESIKELIQYEYLSRSYLVMEKDIDID